MTTTEKINKEVAAATVINDFMFECFKKGMTSEQAMQEAEKYKSEIVSRINGISNQL